LFDVGMIVKGNLFRKGLWIGIITFLLAGLTTPSFTVDLKTAAQNSSPKYYMLEDISMRGICVDIIQAIEHADPEIHITGYHEFLPFSIKFP